MTETGNCPRCQLPLTKSADGEQSLRCEACAGAFVPASEIHEDLLQDLTGQDDRSETDGSRTIACPACGEPMQLVCLGEAELDRCQSCGGVWLDAGEELSADGSADAMSRLSRYLIYSLSLPERTVRSTIGLAAGAAREAATFLVPQSFQSSKTYEIVVRNSLRFLTDDIGGVTTESEEGEEEAVDDYMARKAVGNFVDLAGLATLHLSPIWLLAIVSDVAYGSKSYVLELAKELEQKGLIDDTSTIHHVDDVLEALQHTTGRAASMFDTPPLSIDQLKQSLKETREAATSADYSAVLPESELNQYWKEMREISKRENVSLLGVSGALTMHSLGKLKTVSHGALTGVQVAGGLFNRHVIGHYVDSLNTIRDKGFYPTVRDSYAPYVEAVWTNFAVDKQTWTAELVSGRAFGNAYRSIKGWFGGRDDAATAEQSAEQGDPPVAESNE